MSALDDLKQLEASIVKRYQDLRPAIAEVEELRRVAERLGIDLDAATPPRSRRNGGSASRRAAAPRPRRTVKPAAGRRRRSERRDQVLKLVNERPGITMPEIGKALKVDPTGLYRVARQLEADGSISKRGKELHPAAS